MKNLDRFLGDDGDERAAVQRHEHDMDLIPDEVPADEDKEQDEKKDGLISTLSGGILGGSLRSFGNAFSGGAGGQDEIPKLGEYLDPLEIEPEDLDNVFDIKDFTAASPFEKISKSLELILKGWTSHFHSASDIVASSKLCRLNAKHVKTLQHLLKQDLKESAFGESSGQLPNERIGTGSDQKANGQEPNKEQPKPLATVKEDPFSNFKNPFEDSPVASTRDIGTDDGTGSTVAASMGGPRFKTAFDTPADGMPAGSPSGELVSSNPRKLLQWSLACSLESELRSLATLFQQTMILHVGFTNSRPRIIERFRFNNVRYHLNLYFGRSAGIQSLLPVDKVSRENVQFILDDPNFTEKIVQNHFDSGFDLLAGMAPSPSDSRGGPSTQDAESKAASRGQAIINSLLKEKASSQRLSLKQQQQGASSSSKTLTMSDVVDNLSTNAARFPIKCHENNRWFDSRQFCMIQREEDKDTIDNETANFLLSALYIGMKNALPDSGTEALSTTGKVREILSSQGNSPDGAATAHVKSIEPSHIRLSVPCFVCQKVKQLTIGEGVHFLVGGKAIRRRYTAQVESLRKVPKRMQNLDGYIDLWKTLHDELPSSLLYYTGQQEITESSLPIFTRMLEENGKSSIHGRNNQPRAATGKNTKKRSIAQQSPSGNGRVSEGAALGAASAGLKRKTSGVKRRRSGTSASGADRGGVGGGDHILTKDGKSYTSVYDSIWYDTTAHENLFLDGFGDTGAEFHKELIHFSNETAVSEALNGLGIDLSGNKETITTAASRTDAVHTSSTNSPTKSGFNDGPPPLVPKFGPQIRVRFVYLLEEFDAQNYPPLVGQFLDTLQLLIIWGPFSIEDYQLATATQLPSNTSSPERKPQAPPPPPPPPPRESPAKTASNTSGTSVKPPPPPGTPGAPPEKQGSAQSQASSLHHQDYVSGQLVSQLTLLGNNLERFGQQIGLPAAGALERDSSVSSTASMFGMRPHGLEAGDCFDPRRAPSWQFRVTVGDLNEKPAGILRQKIQYLLDWQTEATSDETVAQSLQNPSLVNPNLHGAFGLSVLQYHLSSAIQNFSLPDEANQNRILDSCFSQMVTDKETVLYDQTMEAARTYWSESVSAMDMVRSKKHEQKRQDRAKRHEERRKHSPRGVPETTNDWNNSATTANNPAISRCSGVDSELSLEEIEALAKNAEEHRFRSFIDTLESVLGIDNTCEEGEKRSNFAESRYAADSSPDSSPHGADSHPSLSPGPASATPAKSTNQSSAQHVAGTKSAVFPKRTKYIATLKALERLEHTLSNSVKGAPAVFSTLLHELIVVRNIVNFKVVCTMYMKLISRIRNFWNLRQLFLPPTRQSQEEGITIPGVTIPTTSSYFHTTASISKFSSADDKWACPYLTEESRQRLAGLGFRRSELCNYKNCLMYQKLHVVWDCIKAQAEFETDHTAYFNMAVRDSTTSNSGANTKTAVSTAAAGLAGGSAAPIRTAQSKGSETDMSAAVSTATIGVTACSEAVTGFRACSPSTTDGDPAHQIQDSRPDRDPPAQSSTRTSAILSLKSSEGNRGFQNPRVYSRPPPNFVEYDIAMFSSGPETSSGRKSSTTSALASIKNAADAPNNSASTKDPRNVILALGGLIAEDILAMKRRALGDMVEGGAIDDSSILLRIQEIIPMADCKLYIDALAEQDNAFGNNSKRGINNHLDDYLETAAAFDDFSKWYIERRKYGWRNPRELMILRGAWESAKEAKRMRDEMMNAQNSPVNAQNANSSSNCPSQQPAGTGLTVVSCGSVSVPTGAPLASAPSLASAATIPPKMSEAVSNDIRNLKSSSSGADGEKRFYTIDPAIFDPEKEAELALFYLENISSFEFWTQLFCMSFQVLIRDFIRRNLKWLLCYEDHFGPPLVYLEGEIKRLFKNSHQNANIPESMGQQSHHHASLQAGSGVRHFSAREAHSLYSNNAASVFHLLPDTPLDSSGVVQIAVGEDVWATTLKLLDDLEFQLNLARALELVIGDTPDARRIILRVLKSPQRIAEINTSIGERRLLEKCFTQDDSSGIVQGLTGQQNAAYQHSAANQHNPFNNTFQNAAATIADATGMPPHQLNQPFNTAASGSTGMGGTVTTAKPLTGTNPSLRQYVDFKPENTLQDVTPCVREYILEDDLTRVYAEIKSSQSVRVATSYGSS